MALTPLRGLGEALYSLASRGSVPWHRLTLRHCSALYVLELHHEQAPLFIACYDSAFRPWRRSITPIDSENQLLRGSDSVGNG